MNMIVIVTSGGLPAISVYLNHDLLPQSDKSMLREVSIN